MSTPTESRELEYPLRWRWGKSVARDLRHARKACVKSTIEPHTLKISKTIFRCLFGILIVLIAGAAFRVFSLPDFAVGGLVGIVVGLVILLWRYYVRAGNVRVRNSFTDGHDLNAYDRSIFLVASLLSDPSEISTVVTSWMQKEWLIYSNLTVKGKKTQSYYPSYSFMEENYQREELVELCYFVKVLLSQEVEVKGLLSISSIINTDIYSSIKTAYTYVERLCVVEDGVRLGEEMAKKITSEVDEISVTKGKLLGEAYGTRKLDEIVHMVRCLLDDDYRILNGLQLGEGPWR